MNHLCNAIGNRRKLPFSLSYLCMWGKKKKRRKKYHLSLRQLDDFLQITFLGRDLLHQLVSMCTHSVSERVQLDIL